MHKTFAAFFEFAFDLFGKIRFRHDLGAGAPVEEDFADEERGDPG